MTIEELIAKLRLMSKEPSCSRSNPDARSTASGRLTKSKGPPIAYTCTLAYTATIGRTRA
jgi:hypothetical protein